MNIVYGDGTIGVHGEHFHYIFSFPQGGPESFVIDGFEWLYRAPKPTFWRATTCNDRGNGFSFRSNMWMGADLFIALADVEVSVDGTVLEGFRFPENTSLIGTAMEHLLSIEIRYIYATATSPATNVEVGYRVDKSGRITVSVRYVGREGLPELPVFGLRFLMPTLARGFEYKGLGGETYPDRMAGGVRGIHQVEGVPVTPYLVPQECGMHMDSEYVRIDRADGDTIRSLVFKAASRKPDDRFAFSVLPYTALELENATHQEELPVPRRTVLCILGAVRGVGGIDSWGSDVEAAYHIPSDKDIAYSFQICP